MSLDESAASEPVSIEVVPGTASLLPRTAELHQELLPHGLFPSLGRRFLVRWHRTFITSPFGVSAVALGPEGQCCGFLLGSSDQRGYVSDTVRHDGHALAALGALALLGRPRLALRFLRTRAGRYAGRLLRVRARPSAAGGASAAPAAPVAVLHALGTVPQVRGQGVGAALLAHYEAEVYRRGVRHIQLVTNADDGAAEFYAKLGYRESDRRPNRDGALVIQLDRDLEVPS